MLDAPARRFSLHYTTSCYPDAFPEGTPSEHYGPEMADQAMADAMQVVGAVDWVWDQLVNACGGEP